MRIAAVQHDIVWEDRDANFERLAPRIAQSVAAGAELVLLTETFSTGFSMTPGIGEKEGGPSSRFLVDQAAEHAALGRHLVRFAFCKGDDVLGEAVTRLAGMGRAGG